MRRLGVIVVIIGTLVASVAANAAMRVSVTPLEGAAKTAFTVSFVVDRPVSGGRWLTVEVLSPVRQNDCENQESAAVTYAPKGKRVSVVLRPVDKFRWCAGVYTGNVHVESRIGCGRSGLDLGPCSVRGSVVARFSFTVTA